jgi:hypothetical protein
MVRCWVSGAVACHRHWCCCLWAVLVQLLAEMVAVDLVAPRPGCSRSPQKGAFQLHWQRRADDVEVAQVDLESPCHRRSYHRRWCCCLWAALVPLLAELVAVGLAAPRQDCCRSHRNAFLLRWLRQAAGVGVATVAPRSRSTTHQMPLQLPLRRLVSYQLWRSCAGSSRCDGTPSCVHSGKLQGSERSCKSTP